MADEPKRFSVAVARTAAPEPTDSAVPATLALTFFALEPFNFAIPVLGLVDDLFLLPLLLHGLAKSRCA